ncbi:MAG: hypothetical protein AAF697_04755 [Pseudomonadota bacterium]
MIWGQVLAILASMLGGAAEGADSGIQSQDPMGPAAIQYRACLEQASERFEPDAQSAETVVDMAASACIREGSQLLQASLWLDADGRLLTGGERKQYLEDRWARAEAIRLTAHQLQIEKVEYLRQAQVRDAGQISTSEVTPSHD